jgi:hypothetical protein
MTRDMTVLDFDELRGIVGDQAEADSRLADRPTAEPALHDLLVRARLG